MKTKTNTKKVTKVTKAPKVNYEELYKSMSTLVENLTVENAEHLAKNMTRRHKINELNEENESLKTSVVLWSVALFTVGFLLGVII